MAASKLWLSLSVSLALANTVSSSIAIVNVTSSPFNDHYDGNNVGLSDLDKLIIDSIPKGTKDGAFTLRKDATGLPREIKDNGVVPDYSSNKGKISQVVHFTGYSYSQLCFKVEDAPITSGCGQKAEWKQLWPLSPKAFENPLCLNYAWNINVVNKKEYHFNKGVDIRLGKCPPSSQAKWQAGLYDWRFGGIRPHDNADEELYGEVKAYIEKLNSGGKKAIITGISGGAPVAYAFIMKQTQAWRKEHIAAFIPQVPVFGGAISSLRALLRGWAIKGVPKEYECATRPFAGHTPSVLWYWPRPGNGPYFWNNTETVVQSKSKKYNADELVGMLRNGMSMEDAATILEMEQKDTLNTFAAPGVDVYSLYGHGVNTESGFAVDEDITPDKYGPLQCPPEPKPMYGDGDGYVTLRSCRRAEEWFEAQAKTNHVVKTFSYKGLKHMDVLKDAQVKKDLDCIVAKVSGNAHGDC